MHSLLSSGGKRLLISILLGAISGVVFLIIGMLHNAQLEFQKTDGEFDYWYAMKVFASWLVLVSTLSYFFLAVIAKVFQRPRPDSTSAVGEDASAPHRKNDRIGGA